MTTCKAEDCTAKATHGELCEVHDALLRGSRAFWTPGRLTLAPMPPNHPTMGQTRGPA